METKVVDVKIKTNTDEVSAGFDKVKKGLKGVSDGAKEAGESVSGISKAQGVIDSIGDGISKINPAFGSAAKGASGLIVKMYEMAANPVGAVLAAIVVTAKFLYEAFGASVEGGKELKQIFEAISAVGAQVKDAMFALGRALIDVTSAAIKFISLDFKGAAEDMKKANKEAANAQKELADAVDGTTFRIIKSLTARQQANDKASKIQDVTQANTNKLLAKSREILLDDDFSIKQRKAALADVTVAESANAKEKLRIAQENLNIQTSIQKAYGVTTEIGKKMNQDIRDATIARDNAETENSQTGFRLNKQKRTLNKQEIAEEKEKTDAIQEVKKAAAAIEKIRFEKQKSSRAEDLKLEEKIELESFERRNQNREKAEKKIISDFAKMSLNLKTQKAEADKALEDEIDRAKKLAEAKRALKNEELNLLSQGISVIKEIAGKNIAIQKAALIAESAVAIARIVLSTQSANAKAVSVSPLTGGMPWVAINTLSGVLSAASTIAATKKALGSLGGGASPSMPSMSSGGGGGSASTAPSFNVVGTSGVNQIAQGLGNQSPIQAYVVGSQVTSQQALDRNIIKTATLGG